MRRRNYEATFILNNDLTEEEHEAAVDRIKNSVEGSAGDITELEDWGEKRLAYPINDLHLGYYYMLNFEGNADTVDELERNLKLIGGVMRYMVIRVDE